MIQLFIGNKEIVLPEDLSFTLIDENSLLTNNGEFSLDITVSLLEPANAIAFDFIQRLNNRNKTITYPDSRLIRNLEVKHGTITIVDFSDTEVMFQFISGNSEIIFNTKDIKIGELDWGTETEVDEQRAMDSLTNLNENFVCAPVVVGDRILNQPKMSDFHWDGEQPKMIGFDSEIVIQPYLKYYIRKLPELLGYFLKFNALESDDFLDTLYIINSVKSLNYADFLPDWTVSDFIENIETFFNVSFDVNNSDRSISIIKLETELQNRKRVNIENVLDSFKGSFEDDKFKKGSFTKIEYDLSTNTYYKNQCFSETVLERCSLMEFENLAALKAYIEPYGHGKFFEIYRDLEFGDDYVLYDGTNKPGIDLLTRVTKNPPNPTYKRLGSINKFAFHGNTEESVLTLHVIPAEMVTKSVHIDYYAEGGVTGHELYFQCPKSSNSFYEPLDLTFFQLVEENYQETPRINNLECAFYSGFIKSFDDGYQGTSYPTVSYMPFSNTDLLPDLSINPFQNDWVIPNETWCDTYFKPNVRHTMKLNGKNGIVTRFGFNSFLNDSTVYIFYFREHPDLKSTHIFSIKNQNYIPIRFERELDNINKETIVKGNFYKLIY